MYALTQEPDDSGETHFVYKLTVPEPGDENEVVKEFGLESKGSWGVRVRNPKMKGTGGGVGFGGEAEFSDE